MSPRPGFFELSGAAVDTLLRSSRRIVITGASGWLGMASLELLEKVLGADFDDRVVAFGSSSRTLSLRSGRKVRMLPLSDLPNLPVHPTWLLQYAFLTRDKVADYSLQEYVNANRRIFNFVARGATGIGVDGVFLASSGAVYNRDRSLSGDLAENPYGVLKLEEERLYTDWTAANSATLVIGRLFNLSGPYINKVSSYVLASLILNALRGQPLQLRATQRVIRSYTSISQVVSTAIGCLDDPAGARCMQFDTTGEREVEIGELARIILQTLGLRELRIERPGIDLQSEDRYVGDGRIYQILGEQYGVTCLNLEQQISVTADFLK